ncbi:MBL fold metallo-hydrolase [Novosphingobium sp. TH158]|uniref:MBL fold metallo-hydrolase n=1 Tax=Novosphingobium sp. TH158 TaxID=2067455 RepID=UPI000C79C984|nr:MBL fold metallo-hydrolase [Novosphingobium sp. TH158]PLK26416.1 MBL fold metallo-hydrolase [Novosphingobium sp. TH158]
MSLSVKIHGAARTVTGSCLEFAGSKGRLLVDCGLFQGSRTLEEMNFDPRVENAAGLDGVILTHAHIDHSGLLPRLVRDGFAGPIWCTPQTAELLEYMLADSGRIQEGEAERINRRRDREGDKAIEPLYTEADALEAWGMTRPVELGEWFEPAPGFRARLWNAGHILGSASAEIEASGVRVMVSGDVGPDNKAFHPDPDGPCCFDHVFCESTYGDRAREKHSIAERREMLAGIVNESRARGGNLIIPSFALERTQELLLDLACLSRDGRIGNAMVFVDSPLANRATQVFARHVESLEDTDGLNVFESPAIHYVNDVSESVRLNSISGAIILAASGMCEAGRIRHHLIHNLHRRDSTVLFVGFQAEGSLGRVIMEGAERVRISGRDVLVRAQIRRIDSYSAHADQSELLDWIAARAPIAGSLFLEHGESGAIDALAGLAKERGLAPSIVVPEIGEAWKLEPASPASRTRTGGLEARKAVGRDWQNSYAELASSLKQRLLKIQDAEAREHAIAEMREVLDSYAAFRETKKARNKGHRAR